MSEIKTNNELATKIATDLEAALTTTDNKKYTGGDDVYVKNLPEGLTEELVQAKEEYDHNFCAGAVLALGRLSVKNLAQHPDAKNTEAVIKTTGKSTLTATWREKREGNVGGKDYVTYGGGAVGITTRADAKTGQIGIAYEQIAKLTAEAVSK